ncbi:MAG TPA: MFS transporter [Candidatus Dormibacteraeota bacterium]|jgi:ACS family tartrate transporter-like MFS transporter|nr:MFS transporter [Candidatus Dormibacteraeota bacterium]
MATPANAAPNLEVKIIRKLQWRLIPFLFLLYVISFIDRVNIGFAALTMNKELAVTSEQFGFVAGVFFFGYVLSGVPSNLMLHKFGARIWIAMILIVWGVIALMMGLVHSVQQLYVLRFLLGLAEGGYFPGVALYLTYWFRQREQAQCIALFLTGLPASNIIGAPLSGWILDHIHWMHLSSWRWLLILEALPAVLCGVATYFVLPSRPAEAKFLSDEEKNWVRTELELEERRKREAKTIGTLQALMIPRVWHTGLILFATNCGVYMLSFWMPQLIKSFSGQISNSLVGFLVMVPYVVGLLTMVAVSRSSDRRLERKFHAAIPAICAGTAMAILGAPHSIATTIVLLSVAIAGMISVYGPAYSLPSELLVGSAVAAGLGLTSSIANAAGFVGPYAAGWISQRTGSLYGGLAAAGISLFASATLALLLPKKTPVS